MTTLGDICLKNYRDKIPCIVTMDNLIKQMLIPNGITIGEFLALVRRSFKGVNNSMLVAKVTVAKEGDWWIGLNFGLDFGSQSGSESPKSQLESLELDLDEKISDSYEKYKNATDKCLHISIENLFAF